MFLENRNTKNIPLHCGTNREGPGDRMPPPTDFLGVQEGFAANCESFQIHSAANWSRI